ncbi:hypothetical protein F5148DRAFT_1175627, partial [Russula earlei]
VRRDVRKWKEVSVGGGGNSKISWTARGDLARFLAHVLVHAPATRLQNLTLRLGG